MSDSLVDKLFHVVDLRGYKKAHEILDSAMVQEITFDNPVVENIIKTVCAKFNISVHELIYGKGRKNARKIAIGFCANYISACCSLNLFEVGEYLKKDESICRKALRIISRLNEKHMSDKLYLQYRNEFDVIFKK